ncbi:hypothetical protein AB0D46_12240 [Streptomyces sp. NPDC048383]|uniref:hypothetical protein n=1 Tax=Streptomyces sp. NPDC048383 TaxID=3155386 RepID=UPI00341731B4
MHAPRQHRKRLAAVAAAATAAGLLTGAMLLGYEAGDHSGPSTDRSGGASAGMAPAGVPPTEARTGSIHFVGGEGGDEGGGTVVGVPLERDGTARSGGSGGSADASGFVGGPDVIAAS